jgi:hypothetical protein
MGSLRAGAARVDITPPKEMFPLKTSQPFGSFEKAHDPTYARALVLDNGKTKVAIVCVDILDWQEDGLPEQIAAALEIPPENVILNPSHDDSSLHKNAPRPGTEATPEAPAFEIMRKGMIEAARQANANLQPARVGYGTGRAEVNTNRNELHGPSDKTVTVLLLTRPTGEPIAIYTSYAVHSIVMLESGTDDGKVQLTSDLAGATQKYVEDHFPGSVAVWAVSAGGDQVPLLTSRAMPPYEAHNYGSAGWTLLDAQSRLLGAEIVRVAKSIQGTSGQAVLWAARSLVTCPAPQRAPQAGGQGAGQGNGGPGQAQGQGQAQNRDGLGGQQPGTQGGVQAATAQTRMLNIPLQLLMVNDIAIAGINGDPAAEIGLQFRQAALFDHNMLVTMIPNSLGHLNSDSQCANRAIDDGFNKMMKSYLPVWNAAH